MLSAEGVDPDGEASPALGRHFLWKRPSGKSAIQKALDKGASLRGAGIEVRQESAFVKEGKLGKRKPRKGRLPGGKHLQSPFE